MYNVVHSYSNFNFTQFSWLLDSFSKNHSMIKKYYVYKNYFNSAKGGHYINLLINNYILYINYIIISFNKYIVLLLLLLPNLFNKNIYKIFTKSNKFYIKPDNNTKDLIIYGNNLPSSLNVKEYTKIVRYMVNIPNRILYILVGLIISNGNIYFSSKKYLNNSLFNDKNNHKAGLIINYNKLYNNKQYLDNYYNNNGLLFEHSCKFKFKQSLKQFEYIWYVYTLLSHYCISLPYYRKARLKGKTHHTIEFVTMALPCFSILRRLFYKGRIKTLPYNIYDIINYESLAHIIMGDGSFTNKGITLNIKSFTVKELVTLINVFYIKFNINCTLHKSRNSYVIYIDVKSVKNLYPFIKPYIIPSMKYKFNKSIKI